MDKLKRVAKWVWYPWLAALFPVIYLYSNNFGKVFTDEFVAACGMAVIAIGLLMGIFWLIVRSFHKAGIMTMAVIIPFFAYSPLIDVITEGRPGALNKLLPVKPLVIGLALAAVLVVAITVWLSVDRSRKLTTTLNILTGALVAFNLGSLTVAEVRHLLASGSYSAALAAEVRAPKVMNDAQHPDVYYIIMDAYPSNSSLMAENGYDNSAFTSALEERGFYVAYDSQSNYPVTLPSIASSLNMRYLVPHEGHSAVESYDLQREMIADSAVSDEFLSLGYTYIFMMSGFDTSSASADWNIDHYPDGMRRFPHDGPPPADSYRSPFWPVVYDATMLSDMGLAYPPSSNRPNWPTDWANSHRVLATFDEVPIIADMPEATFTAVHFILPHHPVRFTRDGKLITGRDNMKLANGPDLEKAFFEQLAFTNSRTLQMIDEILEKSDVPPIIIIQGDHGGLLGHGRLSVRFYKILNAYHFPGSQGQAGLTQNISPVNSFRVLFNTYFGTNYEILENRYFNVPKVYNDLFDLVEITLSKN